MLRNARPVIFHENYYSPEGIIFVQSKPKELLNNKGQFLVQIDEKTPYVEELVKKAQRLNLTVSGDGTAPVRGGDVRFAQNGDFLTVGTSSRFDLNWIKRAAYVCDNGYKPVYKMTQDWRKINTALEEYADLKNNKYNATCPFCGSKVQIHSRFAVVDGRVRSYDDNELAILVPKKIEPIELGYRVIRINLY